MNTHVNALHSKARSYTISEICAEFNVTPRTLRFYEAKNLLSPERRGTRRIFSARDRARLYIILRAKKFGVSLAVIGEMLDLYDIGDGQITQLSRTLDFGRKHLAEMVAQRDQLTEAIDDMTGQLALIERTLVARQKLEREEAGQNALAASHTG